MYTLVMTTQAARLRIDASSLRRDLFNVLRKLDIEGPVEILRNGRVVALLQAPPAREDAPGARSPKPHVDSRRLARICKKHRIKKLSLFGSVVRDDFGSTSDVDVLYELEKGQKESLSHFCAAQDALSDLFGRSVDFIKRSLIENSDNPYRQKSILEDERVVYENGRAVRSVLAELFA
jgi:predicted nucleotidyltransferase